MERVKSKLSMEKKSLASPSTPDGKYSLFQTPVKTPSSSLSRVRSRSVALSIKDIRKAACQSSSSKVKVNSHIGSPKQKPDCSRADVKSAKRQITNWLDDSKSPLSCGVVPKVQNKYDLLSDIFYALENSLRLLRQRGSPRTFSNVSCNVEKLTERRFTYKFLAQIKYLLPEVINLQCVSVFDERTSCTKKDLRITLLYDSICSKLETKSEISSLQLRDIFQNRVADFVKSHPEGEDIPVAELPEPFNWYIDNQFIDSSTPVKRRLKMIDDESSPLRTDSSIFTPLKDVAHSCSPLSSTPALPPPKRPCNTPENTSTNSSERFSKRSARCRSLNFESPQSKTASSIFSEELLNSLMEKENKFKEQIEKTPQTKRKQMIASLPKLFNAVHFLFQSLNKCVLSKEELLSQILSSRRDAFDREEVEEQLKLMVELVPHYIVEKTTSSGDHLVSINKLSSPDTIRAKLEAAT